MATNAWYGPSGHGQGRLLGMLCGYDKDDPVSKQQMKQQQTVLFRYSCYQFGVSLGLNFRLVIYLEIFLLLTTKVSLTLRDDIW